MSSHPSQAPFRFQHIVCDDVTLHVAQIGVGAPIIFLHGFPEHWRAFAPMMTQLATQFQCIAPDQRGFGKSSRPLDHTHYSINRLADDIACLITNLGLEKIHLVAHDWGGLVAWHFASRHPDLLDRLVVFNAPHPYCLQHALDTDPAQRLASSYALQFSQPSSHLAFAKRAKGETWAAFFGADEAAGYISAVEKAAIMENWEQPDAWATMLNWYRAAGFDYSGDPKIVRPLPQPIQAPTLLIWGKQDTLFAPSVLGPHAEFIRDFHLEMSDEGGHAVFRQFQASCATLVKGFLSQSG